MGSWGIRSRGRRVGLRREESCHTGRSQAPSPGTWSGPLHEVLFFRKESNVGSLYCIMRHLGKKEISQGEFIFMHLPCL